MNWIDPNDAVIEQHLRGPRRASAAVTAPVVGEPTAADGLVVCPHLTQLQPDAAWTYSGEWTVRHRLSGRSPAAHVRGSGLGHARDLAALLGDLDVDWTQAADELPVGDPQIGAAVRGVVDRVRDAVRDARPVRLRPSSWVEVPPPYWLAAGVEPGDGCFYPQWGDAADALIDGERRDVVVRRDTAAWWDLALRRRRLRRAPGRGRVRERPDGFPRRTRRTRPRHRLARPRPRPPAVALSGLPRRVHPNPLTAKEIPCTTPPPSPSSPHS